MKRYKKLTTTIPYMRNPKSIFHDDYYGRESIEQMEIENKMVEHPQGEWVKWEDVKGLAEDIGIESHDGYARTKDIATGMAVSLHQKFYDDAATFRFIFKDSEPIIIDVDMDAFKKFMETNATVKLEYVKGVEGQVLESIELECNCDEMFINHAYNWICPAHGYKKR